VLHDFNARLEAAGMFQPHLGRRLPGLMLESGLDNVGVSATTLAGRRGDDVYETIRLSMPSARPTAASLGCDTEAFDRFIEVLDSPQTLLFGMSYVFAWGQKPADTTAP
jgi:hypothetical protein